MDDPRRRIDVETTDSAGRRSSGESFLVVARGHQDLLQEVKATIAEMSWVRVIEDRRHERVLLPREGREGRAYFDEG